MTAARPGTTPSRAVGVPGPVLLDPVRGARITVGARTGGCHDGQQVEGVPGRAGRALHFHRALASVHVAEDGSESASLFGNAAESGAPLTMIAFQQGLPGNIGLYIVVLCVFLFAIFTAIAWSYYGDRCANYLFGHRAVLPYKFAFVTMHFVGAILTLAVAWTLGDVFLGIVILPNLFALILLAGKVKQMTVSYFDRKPWVENREAHRRWKEQQRHR